MSSSPTSRQILVYGHDAILLETRRMVLQQAGFLVKVAHSQDDIRSLLGQAEAPYSLIVVCYTVTESEKQWIKTTADVSGAPVHQLTPLVLPAELLRQTEAILRIRQVHS